MKSRAFLATFFIFVASFSFLSLFRNASAQFQDFDFSANSSSCSSYQCRNITGGSSSLIYNSSEKLCECIYTSSTGSVSTEKALLKPPKLQQAEIWFVRVVYIIWGIIGSFSFLMLVYLGYQYTITRGDVTKITAIRQRIINFVLGFILVFTAIPILTTFFRVLGLNGDIQCYKFDTLPRFQFFFPELCTDPKNVLVGDPCNFSLPDATGYPCTPEGQTYSCSSAVGGVAVPFNTYECSGGAWIRY